MITTPEGKLEGYIMKYSECSGNTWEKKTEISQR